MTQAQVQETLPTFAEDHEQEILLVVKVSAAKGSLVPRPWDLNGALQNALVEMVHLDVEVHCDEEPRPTTPFSIDRVQILMRC
jgi:hypothetical protein